MAIDGETEVRTVEEEELAQAQAVREEETPPAPIEEAAVEEAPAAALAGEELVRAVEALLLASPEPISPEALRDVTGAGAAPLQTALAAIAERFCDGRSGIVLVEVAGGWQLRTAPGQAAAVRKLLRVRPQRLTRAALETLALVAYRQPVTRAEVEDVRGVDCGAVLKALLERRLLRILGKKEEIGRPLLYGTTREFLEFFGLPALDQLPTLREFQELSEEHRAIVEEQAPAPKPGVEGIAELADEALSRKLAEKAEEDEAALADLEAAMEEAEVRAKLAAETLAPEQAAAAPVAPPPAG